MQFLEDVLLLFLTLISSSFVCFRCLLFAIVAFFIMHLLQNSPDNRGMITLCDISSL